METQLQRAANKLKISKNPYYSKPIEVDIEGIDPERTGTITNILYTTDKVPSMSQVNYVIYSIEGVKRSVNKMEYKKLMDNKEFFDSKWEAQAAKDAKIAKAKKEKAATDKNGTQDVK